MDIDLVINGQRYVCTPVTEQEPHRVVLFAQQDARWRSNWMGGVPQTIGGYGCAMVCAAMVYSQIDANVRPDEFNDRLTDENGYYIVNGREAHLAWDRLPRIFPELEWLGRESWTRELRDHELERVFGFIDEAPLALWVDFNPAKSGFQSHFVLAVQYDAEGSDVLIADPWGGKTAWLMEAYGRGDGDSLARAIWGYRRLVVR